MTKRCIHLGMGLLALATLVVYAPSVLRNDFVILDDQNLITRNPLVTGGLTLGNILWAFSTYDPELYIPLTFLTYQLEATIAGITPQMFHTTNLLLHIGSTVLVYAVTSELLRRFATQRGQDLRKGSGPFQPARSSTGPDPEVLTPSFVALIFALHPVSTEAVVWASARKDVLSTFFALLTLLLYLRGKHIWSAGTFALALLSKASVVTLPLVLLLLPQRGQDLSHPRPTLKVLTPFFALSLLFGIVAYLGKTTQAMMVTLPESVLLASKATFFYLGKFFFPFGFTVFYPQQTPITVTSPEFFLPLLGILGFFGILVVSWRKGWHVVTFSLCFYLLLLAPSFGNFWKNGFLYFASDRYAYLASVGVTFLVGSIVIPRVLKPYRSAAPHGGAVLLGAFFVVLAAFLGLLSYRQAATWANGETLHRHALALYPTSLQNLHNLGSVLFEQGKVEEAQEYYLRALAQDPTLAEAYANLGRLRVQEGNVEAAIGTLREGLSNLPDRPLLEGDVQLFSFLAALLEEQGKSTEAIALLKSASERAPKSFTAQLNYGILTHKHGNLEEAVPAYEAALALDRRNLDARYKLAGAYAELGRLPEAIGHLEYVISRDPSHERAAFHLEQLRRMMHQ